MPTLKYSNEIEGSQKSPLARSFAITTEGTPLLATGIYETFDDAVKFAKKTVAFVTQPVYVVDKESKTVDAYVVVPDENNPLVKMATENDIEVVQELLKGISGVEGGVVPIAAGGTGASNVASALANLGAAPTGHTHTASDVGASPTGHTHTAADAGAVAHYSLPANQTYPRAYIATENGDGVEALVDTGIIAGSVVRRTTGGTVRTNSPTADNDAVNLKFLRENLPLYRHDVSFYAYGGAQTVPQGLGCKVNFTIYTTTGTSGDAAKYIKEKFVKNGTFGDGTSDRLFNGLTATGFFVDWNKDLSGSFETLNTAIIVQSIFWYSTPGGAFYALQGWRIDGAVSNMQYPTTVLLNGYTISIDEKIIQVK